MQEEWDDPDRFSFEDSDRFDEDSLCSWSSEPESLCNNWRGWKRPYAPLAVFTNKIVKKNVTDKLSVLSLTELSARCVASYIPFELVEHVYPPVPEVLQLRIAFWSFPDNEDDIRLYSCLANGSADEFQRGEHLFRERAVKDALQIGFHLSATVTVPVPRTQFNVAITFDRRRISSCNCTCPSPAYWCSHIVAVCLYRIHMSQSVCLRAPVSESLQRLRREQLQKFAQYLISELPRQILPTAQRLLDELLSSRPTAMNALCGAPDPTAGASAHDHSAWYLDERTLRAGVGRILVKFCVPAPVVFSDVNYLSASAPPAAAEWASLLRPLRGREPEGMWNLLSIVREMFRRNDRNAVPLLDIITDECMACEQILVWWYNTKAALVAWGGGSGKIGGNGMGGGGAGSTNASQHACSSLCDEVVALWRLAALNPALSPTERETLRKQLIVWHTRVLEKVLKSRSSLGARMTARSGGVNAGPSTSSRDAPQPLHDSDAFPGFTPAIQACQLDWDEYQIPGVTYASDTNPLYHSSFTVFRSVDSKSIHQVNCSKAVLNNEMSSRYYHCSVSGPSHLPIHRMTCHRPRLTNTSHPSDHRRARVQLQIADGNRSSASSEGFCENEDVRGDADISDSGLAGPIAAALDAGARVITAPSHDPDITSGSESQQSGDECSSLYCDGKTSSSGDNEDDSEKSVPQDVEESIIIQDHSGDNMQENSNESEEVNTCSGSESDEWEVLFARAEGLYSHGFTKEACQLGARLARELLTHPPDLMSGIPPIVTTPPNNITEACQSTSTGTPDGESGSGRRGRRNRHHTHHYHLHRSHHQHHHLQKASAALQRVTLLASATLAKCAFLCTVLADYPEHRELMFRVGLFGLEMARPPASTKPLEVKLANQETELVQLLKKIPPEAEQLELAREKARLLRDGVLRSRGPALLPIALAGFMFDILVQPGASNEAKKLMGPNDEELGLRAAIAALGLKVSVSEADHPLLCEGTRRQRGELALSLLSHCRDRPEQLAAVMNQLLDRDIHQLTKGPMVPAYYAAEGVTVAAVVAASVMQQPIMMSAPPSMPSSSAPVTTTVTASVSLPIRSKERYKGKRAYPSVPNQPSEALAHFMFELAKSVLAKAGGSSATSLFTQTAPGQQHRGPHRGLHMAAFQLGLYALGLHNCVSANWLSRTYSSHVSWITGQAMDIGTPAIAFLVGAWEGQLTPPEAAGIADRASRGRHALAVRAAAELALSVLPHAHALNYNEIQRAVLQCKEQSDAMLERACLTVEGAAKGGGVYPEVLFTVARCWHELFLRHGRPPGAPPDDLEVDHDAMATSLIAPLTSQPSAIRVPPATYRAPSIQLAPLQPVQYALAAGPYAFTYHPQPLAYPAPLYQLQYSPPPPQYTLAPQYFVPQPVSVVHSGHPSQYAAAAPTSAYGTSQPAPLSATHASSLSQHNQLSTQLQLSSQVQLPAQVQLPNQVQLSAQVQLPTQLQLSAQVLPHFPPVPSSPASSSSNEASIGGVSVSCAGGPSVSVVPPAAPAPPPPPPHQYSAAQLRRLLAAYRVGMLALEMQGRRVHDDRPQNKYGRNPPYGEHVKWLLRVAKKLGPQYLQQFCVCAVNSVVSPFVLYELAVEAAHWLTRTPLAPMAPAPHGSHVPHNLHASHLQPLAMQHLRGTLAPLVQKCQQMFIQSMHQKLYHLSSTDYDDFVSIVLSARAAFHLTPEGNVQFKEWLQSLKRSKSCKKELWAQINAALQNGK